MPTRRTNGPGASQRSCRLPSWSSRDRRELRERIGGSGLDQALVRCRELRHRRYWDALARIADYRARWLRPPQQWDPGQRSGDEQIRSLVAHLFCRYALPQFLLRAFEDERLELTELLVELGAGHSLYRLLQEPRYARLPRLTRHMCHLAGLVGEPVPVIHGFRRVQVTGCGGSNRLAEAICRSPELGRVAGDEPFWATVIAWLCRQGELTSAQVATLLETIAIRRSTDGDWRIAGRTVASVLRPPPAPAVAEEDGLIEERTLAEIERLFGSVAEGGDHRTRARRFRKRHTDVYEWILRDLSRREHDPAERFPLCDRYGRSGRKFPGRLPASGFQSWSMPRKTSDGELERWSIKEIRSTTQLDHHARAQVNCVRLYVGRIREGAYSIWALRRNLQPVLTIGVRNGHRLVYQALGKGNRRARAEEIALVRIWAKRNRLQMWDERRPPMAMFRWRLVRDEAG